MSGLIHVINVSWLRKLISLDSSELVVIWCSDRSNQSENWRHWWAPLDWYVIQYSHVLIMRSFIYDTVEWISQLIYSVSQLASVVWNCNPSILDLVESKLQIIFTDLISFLSPLSPWPYSEILTIHIPKHPPCLCTHQPSGFARKSLGIRPKEIIKSIAKSRYVMYRNPRKTSMLHRLKLLIPCFELFKTPYVAFLKANCELLRGNYQKSLRVLNTSVLPLLNDETCNIRSTVSLFLNNNLGALHYSMRKYNMACLYFSKANDENTAIAKQNRKTTGQFNQDFNSFFIHVELLLSSKIFVIFSLYILDTGLVSCFSFAMPVPIINELATKLWLWAGFIRWLTKFLSRIDHTKLPGGD